MAGSDDIAIATVHCIVFIVNIVGNSLVCAIIKRNKDMRTPINYLLVNLAIGDMMYAAFIAPEVILTITGNHPGGKGGTVMCKLLTAGILAWVGGFSSMVTLVVIAFERYFAVICPYENKRLTKEKLKVIIPGSWIFAVIFNLPLFLVVEVKDGYCKNSWVYGQDWMPKAYDLLWSSLVAVSVAMMAGLYSRIIYTLWLKRVEDNQPAFQQRGVIRVRKRVTLMAATVTLMFGVCWVSDIIAHSVDYYTSLSTSKDTYSVIHTLILLNTAVNPFVYALINKTFREKLKGMLCCSCTSSTASFSPPAVARHNAEFANKGYLENSVGPSSSE